MSPRSVRLPLSALLVVVLSSIGMAVSQGPAGASSPAVTTLTMEGAKPYTPHAPAGSTDDYHCTLVNPHTTSNSFIVSSHFYPHSVEVHHAILFLIPPGLDQAAEKADDHGKGWTCFGETPLPGTEPLNHISNTPWLAAWAPGHGEDVEPAGTGVKFPAHSMVVMQIHYNLLRGDKPVRAELQLHTVPAPTHLKPLSLDLMPAPPDIPCPTGVTGPLCNRAASLANMGKDFGQAQVQFVSVIESVCGRNPVDPPAGDTTSCTWPIQGGREIVRLGVHMHLLGVNAQITLDPGTPQAKTLLNVPDYNFDYQKSYTLAHPVLTKPGDRIGISCTYNPTLRQELPQLRKLPPAFITWGDGTSDEMCLALVQSVSATGPAVY